MAVQRCFWGRSSLHAELLESPNPTNNEKVLPQQDVGSHSFFKVFFLISWCTNFNVHEVFVQLQQQQFDDGAVAEQVETCSHTGQYTIQLVKQGQRTRSVLEHTQAKLPWHNPLHRLSEFLSTARLH